MHKLHTTIELLGQFEAFGIRLDHGKLQRVTIEALDGSQQGIQALHQEHW